MKLVTATLSSAEKIEEEFGFVLAEKNIRSNTDIHRELFHLKFSTLLASLINEETSKNEEMKYKTQIPAFYFCYFRKKPGLEVPLPLIHKCSPTWQLGGFIHLLTDFSQGISSLMREKKRANTQSAL